MTDTITISAAEPKRRSGLWIKLPAFALGLVLAWVIPSVLLYQPMTRGGEPVWISTDIELVGHAGIGLPQAAYSNSMEALEAAVARGFNMVEVDLITTSDGQIVAAHDWEQSYFELHPGARPFPARLARLLPASAPSHLAFMQSKMRDMLTPVDLDALANWLNAQDDVWLVTDVKDGNLDVLSRLAARGDVPLDRVMPQIYYADELAGVRALGFDHVIYTLYREPNANIGEVITFASSNGLSVTIPDARAVEETVRAFAEARVPLYVHTINGAARAEQLAEWGASGVYTDFLVLASGE